jgi:adenylate cyclase
MGYELNQIVKNFFEFVSMQNVSDTDTITFKQRMLLTIVTLLTVWTLIERGMFQHMELWLYDHMLAIRSVTTYSPPITIVTVSEADLIRLQSGSIPDKVLAEILQSLLKNDPDVIGVDLYRDIPIPPGTEKLAKLVNAHQEIIMVQQYGDVNSEGIPPPAYLQRDEQSGCTDFPLDSDNSVRRGLIYLGNDPVCFSFAYLIAQRYLAKRNILPSSDTSNPDILILGKNRLPPLQPNDGGYRNLDNHGYQILLDYHFPPHLLRRYSLAEVLEDRLAKEDVNGKIILIGSYAHSGKDFFSIPAFQGDTRNQTTPGIDMHGILADQLVRLALEDPQLPTTLPEWLEWLWSACCATAGVWLGSRLYKIPVFIVILFIGTGIITICELMVFLSGIWIPLIPAVLSWFFSSSIASAWIAHIEHRHRTILMSLFSRHVSSPIALKIWQQRSEFINGGRITPQRMTATVLFSDLTGFTHIAETLEPEVFITWLNEYLDVMTSVIELHQGVVIRFIGDAIMAGFGIPVPSTNPNSIASDAQRAALCALELQEALIRLNKNWISKGFPQVCMRIGINTGPLLAGSLGNSQRLEYTLHGDTVNTAARLESYRKQEVPIDFFSAPCRILVSSNTERYLHSGYSLVPFGYLNLPGKYKKIETFQLKSL